MNEIPQEDALAYDCEGEEKSNKKVSKFLNLKVGLKFLSHTQSHSHLLFFLNNHRKSKSANRCAY